MSGEDLLERLQADCFAVVESMPRLSLVNVIQEDEGSIQQRVADAIGGLNTSNGKRAGLVVVVALPEVPEAEENLPGPAIAITQEVLILEQIQINRDATKGTGIRSSQAAMAILNALHLHALGTHTLYARRKPITPEKGLRKGYIGHVVTLNLKATGMQGPGKVAAIHPATSDGQVVLTCATEGAEIRYTTDGSYPSPGNPQSQIYTGPLDLAIGTACRAAAYAPDLNPGDCLEFTITP